MEDDRSSNFCTNCGAAMRESDTFCTTCGASKDRGTPASPTPTQNRNTGKRSTTLIGVTILSAIWAVVALYIGLDAIFTAESAVAGIDDAGFWDFMYELGVTSDDLVGMIIAIGSIVTEAVC